MSDSEGKKLDKIEVDVTLNNEQGKTQRPPSGESYFRNKDRQAAEAEAQEQRQESEKIQADLEQCRRVLTKLIVALNNREIIPERVALAPSILLLPFPYVRSADGFLEMHVHGMDIDNTSDPYDKLFNDMHRLTYFPSLPETEAQSISNGWSLASRVNLVKALIVYMENLIASGSVLEETCKVNFLEAAEVVGTANFVPARQNAGTRKFETFYVNRKVITIDLITLIQFQRRLVEFFEQKKREEMGLCRRRESVKMFAVNSGSRAISSQKTVRSVGVESRERLEDALKDYLEKIKK